jgi:hypothetical protein
MTIKIKQDDKVKIDFPARNKEEVEKMGLHNFKRKKARLEEIHEINQKILKDLKAETLKQNKDKGLFYKKKE